MFDKIFEFMNKITSVIINGSNDLCNRLDSVNFTVDSIVIKAFGMIRYLGGDVLYYLVISIIYVGAGLLIVKIIQILLETIAKIFSIIFFW